MANKEYKNFTKNNLKPYTGSIILFFALMCMATLFSIASILSVSNFLQILFDTPTDAVENPSQLEVILNKVYDYCLSFGKHKALWLFAAIIFVIYFLKDLFTYLASYFIGSTRNKIIRNILTMVLLFNFVFINAPSFAPNQAPGANASAYPHTTFPK